MSKFLLYEKMLLSLLALHLIAGHVCAQEFMRQDIFPEFQQAMCYPAMTPDGQYLIFLASDETSMTAYQSHMKDGGWTAPEPLDFINDLITETGNEVGGFSFNHDGTVLYFHAKLRTEYFDIFYSKKTRGRWGRPQRLGKPISADADLFSPSISSDNKTLFVLRAQPTTKKKADPCKELLLFEKDKEGKWVGPKYLPQEFNIGCQETPFFCADNNILLFASRRKTKNSLGKEITDGDSYDIYYARRIDEDNWFYPVYVDALKSEFDVLSPALSSTSDYFLVSVKPKKKKQLQKIYATYLPEDKKPSKTFVLSGSVTDLYTSQPIETDIVVQDAVTSTTKGVFPTTDDGRFSIILTQGSFYKADISKTGYSHTYHYKDLYTIPEGSTKEEVDAKLFSKVNLEFNVYDNELFYPLQPNILIVDSATGKPVKQYNIVNASKGKYECTLALGRKYKIRVECANFETQETYFDLGADVVYSRFEKSMELQAARRRLVLNVKNKKGESILPVMVNVRNLTRDETGVALVAYDEDGNPVLSLRTSDTYELNVSKKGYTYFNTNISVAPVAAGGGVGVAGVGAVGVAGSGGIGSATGGAGGIILLGGAGAGAFMETLEIKDIELDELTAQTKMVFNNITFETNSAELNAESHAELHRIIDFMKNNPHIKIEIAAHTDDVGSEVFNLKLSEKRAAYVEKFLIDSDVPKWQLVSKGYGEVQPVVPNTSDENRAINRRVEIKIIDNQATE
ncbi:MAG: OmpA family protein [Prevotellaceae bacterium]|jgi:outer membrane protein OmpA-like peptidoglycan-associated protein|nr:OmpA family protein [Prevotellaceae bacterium]